MNVIVNRSVFDVKISFQMLGHIDASHVWLKDKHCLELGVTFETCDSEKQNRGLRKAWKVSCHKLELWTQVNEVYIQKVQRHFLLMFVNRSLCHWSIFSNDLFFSTLALTPFFWPLKNLFYACKARSHSTASDSYASTHTPRNVMLLICCAPIACSDFYPLNSYVPCS